MPSFSMSEISSMISSKKYRIKRGDTLSGLTDKFQGSFPSAKCMNKNSLMDKIYNMNKSAFGGKKEIIFEGKDLDLKFVADCRCNLKIDKSKKEYVFNDEDRLVFAIKGQNNFWDDFIKVDRNIGEYMKTTFRNMPSSSLPKSIPLPMGAGFSSGGSGRKIMEEIKRNLSGAMVTTDQIVEAFYKLMGYNASKSEIQNCACKLEKENGTCRCSANAPCSAPRDKLEQLSCKCLEDCYCCMPIKQDKYIITKFDVGMGLDKLLKRIKSGLKVFLNGKEIKGNEKIKEGDCLIPIDKIEGTIYKFQSGKSWSNVDLDFRDKLEKAMIELYCQYKKENKSWTILEISSAYRSEKDQARVMIDTYLHKGRREMSKIYSSKWDNAVDLISDLYYDGNHLNCKGIDIEGIPHPCEHGSISSCKDKEQKALFNRLPSNEQSVFSGNIKLKNNKEETKKVLEAWIKASNVLSNHTKKTAVDFSRRNHSQNREFNDILKNYKLEVSKVYDAGNFHVQYMSSEII